MGAQILNMELKTLLRHTLKAFCEVNIGFERKLEIYGSIHIRADDQDVIAFLLNDRALKQQLQYIPPPQRSPHIIEHTTPVHSPHGKKDDRCVNSPKSDKSDSCRTTKRSSASPAASISEYKDTNTIPTATSSGGSEVVSPEVPEADQPVCDIDLKTESLSMAVAQNVLDEVADKSDHSEAIQGELGQISSLSDEAASTDMASSIGEKLTEEADLYSTDVLENGTEAAIESDPKPSCPDETDVCALSEDNPHVDDPEAGFVVANGEPELSDVIEGALATPDCPSEDEVHFKIKDGQDSSDSCVISDSEFQGETTEANSCPGNAEEGEPMMLNGEGEHVLSKSDPTTTTTGDTASALPIAGDTASAPPIAGDTASAPPIDGDTASAPPIDGDTASTPPAAGDTASAPPIVGDTASAPPIAGDTASAPPIAGDTASAPPIAGDTASAPPIAGDTASAPPIAASVLESEMVVEEEGATGGDGNTDDVKTEHETGQNDGLAPGNLADYEDLVDPNFPTDMSHDPESPSVDPALDSAFPEQPDSILWVEGNTGIPLDEPVNEGTSTESSRRMHIRYNMPRPSTVVSGPHIHAAPQASGGSYARIEADNYVGLHRARAGLSVSQSHHHANGHILRQSVAGSPSGRPVLPIFVPVIRPLGNPSIHRHATPRQPTVRVVHRHPGATVVRHWGPQAGVRPVHHQGTSMVGGRPVTFSYVRYPVPNPHIRPASSRATRNRRP